MTKPVQMRVRSAPKRAAFWGAVSLALMAGCTPNREPGNVYRGALIANLKTFDPAQASDSYSNQSQYQIYEALYEYKYLARPYEIQPLLAAALPEVSADGRVYTIKVRTDIEFQDDEAFPGGKGRRMNAHDFVYSIKRLTDVRTQTYGWWIFDGKVVGLNEFRAASERLPALPDSIHPALYGQEIPGLRALDDSTVRIELTRPFPYFKYILAMPYAAVVAHEVVDYYGPEFLNHPVGTGPYRLTEWRRGLRLTFERNPKYKHGFYPTEGTAADSAAGMLADAGKPLPFIDKVELYVYNETQPMWLNFLRGNLDRSSIPKDNYSQAVSPAKGLREEFAAQGIRMTRVWQLDLTYICFNMLDPVLGKHRKVRQAMQLGYDVETVIERFYNGRGIRAQSLVPPELAGYDSAFKSPFGEYNPSRARKLLEEAGFPGGKGLPTMTFLTVASTEARQRGEHFAQNMAAIGIKVKVESCTWPEYLERLQVSKFQLVGASWMADYPDPENFLQLLYGPNKPPGENNASYQNDEYDRLFDQMTRLQDGPERMALIARMKAIAATDAPWIFAVHRVAEVLSYKRIVNMKPHAVAESPVKYYRVVQP